MAYYVIQCLNCGRSGVKGSNYIADAQYKCFFCNKGFSIRSKKSVGFRVKVKGPLTSKIASVICRMENEAFIGGKVNFNEN